MQFISPRRLVELVKILHDDKMISQEEKAKRMLIVVDAIPMTSKTANDTLWAYGLGYFSVAWLLFQKMKREGYQLSRRNCVSLIRAISEADISNIEKYHRTLEVYDEIKSAKHIIDVKTGRKLMQMVADTERSRFNLAVAILREMMSWGFKPDSPVFTVLLRICGRHKDMNTAFRLIQDLRTEGLLEGAVVSAVLIDSLGKQGYIGQAFDVMGELRASGQKPGTATYNALLNACVEFLPERVQDVWLQMKEDKILPNVVSYNIILKAFRGMGDPRPSEQIFRTLLNSGLSPDLVTLRALMRVNCQSGKLNRAKELFKSIETYGLQADEKTFHVMIHGYAKTGRLDDALSYIDVMSRRGIVLKETCPHGPIAEAHLHAGRIKEAKEVFEYYASCGSSGANRALYNVLLQYYADIGQLDRMIEYLKVMESSGPNLRSSAITLSWTLLRTANAV